MLETARDYTILAGVAMLLLGTWIVALQPSSRVYRALAALILLRGMFYTLVGYNDSVLGAPWVVATAVTVAIPFAAVDFALVTNVGWSDRTQQLARGLLLVLLVVAEVGYIVSPEAYLGRDFNLALGDLFVQASYVTYAVLALVFAVRAQRAPGRMRRGGLLLMALAFAFSPAFEVAFQWSFLSHDKPIDATFFVHNMLVLLATGILAFFVMQLVGMARSGEPSMRSPVRRSLGAMSAPLLCGLAVAGVWNLPDGVLALEEPWRVALGMKFLLGAFWHLCLLGLVVFAVARYQTLGVERGFHVGLRASAAAASVLTLAGAAVLVMNRVPFAGQLERVAAVAGVVAFMALPVTWFSQRWVERVLPGVENSPAYAESLRIRAFWHDAEGLLADGLLMDQEREALESLRQKHRLDEAEARSVLDQVLEQLPPVRTSHFPLLGERDAVVGP